ncbi:hypothetical protein [Pontibacter oryzae]|uniref:Uncharacterized protein n=1 Tax=Pontibacter oryzae TaxID=2304593 RepID=A0A399SHV5_9BACT|nr:hypothetical protein [Pontibacter oryzae]RIJ42439.1 hypothetical protein D1627_00780 [Pontibacter oryzae]
MNRAGAVARIHGAYWGIGAMWPLVHMDSFIWVTGPKEELWLVRCLSLLMIVVGLVLFIAGTKKRITPDLKWLGVGGALVMALVDFFYVFSGKIREVYLLDGVAELILIGLWFWAGNRGILNSSLPTAK